MMMSLGGGIPELRVCFSEQMPVKDTISLMIHKNLSPPQRSLFTKEQSPKTLRRKRKEGLTRERKYG
jgi:hypothetical protein